MFEDGMSYPVRGDWLGRIAIGGLLFFFSFLLFPVFFALGYLIEVLKTTVEGAEEPPAFDDWGDLFVKGLVGTLISIVYSLVPVVVFSIVGFVLFGVFGLAGSAAGSAAGEAGSIIAGFGLIAVVLLGLLSIPVILLAYYMVPAALTNYAIEGDLGAAFDVGTLKPVLLSSEYLVAVLLPLVVAVLLWIATSILSITIVGLLLVPFLQFYGQVAVFRMFGTAFETVAGRSRADTTPTGVAGD